MLSARAFAKINLSLEVGPRRPDGYHDLETLFQTIDLADEIEITESDDLVLEVEGEAPNGPENLVVRAARALAERAGRRAAAHIVLRKRIPTGGGLGGGSSDAATTLLALDRFWGTGLAMHELHALASTLGSDVPFFLLGGTALGLGRGERLFALGDAPEIHVVLGIPGKPVSTPHAFRALDELREGGVAPLEPPRAGDPRVWSWEEGVWSLLRNDLEAPVFREHPDLARLRTALEQSGALHARLSGSGSTVYGLFATEPQAREGLRTVEREGVRGLVTRTLGRSSSVERCLPLDV